MEYTRAGNEDLPVCLLEACIALLATEFRGRKSSTIDFLFGSSWIKFSIQEQSILTDIFFFPLVLSTTILENGLEVRPQRLPYTLSNLLFMNPNHSVLRSVTCAHCIFKRNNASNFFLYKLVVKNGFHCDLLKQTHTNPTDISH